MTDAQSIAQRYIDLWNERDATKRLEILAASWTSEARYTDPLASVRGGAEISTLIGGVQQRFPDFSFALLGKVDGFGDNVALLVEPGPEGRSRRADQGHRLRKHQGRQDRERDRLPRPGAQGGCGVMQARRHSGARRRGRPGMTVPHGNSPRVFFMSRTRSTPLAIADVRL